MFRRDKKTVTKPRGMDLPPPTQDHVHIRGVLPEGVLVADDGTMAAACVVAPLDLSLTDIRGRQQVYMRFSRCLAGLPHTCPIQIMVGSLPQRCEEYRDRVGARVQRYLGLAEKAGAEGAEAEKERFLHMADVAQAHRDLFEYVLQEQQPREELYLVVVWHNPFPVVGRNREVSDEKLGEGHKELDRRLAQVKSGLERAGLRARRATAEEMVGAVHAFYHMTTSPLARLESPALSSLVVGHDVDLVDVDGGASAMSQVQEFANEGAAATVTEMPLGLEVTRGEA